MFKLLASCLHPTLWKKPSLFISFLFLEMWISTSNYFIFSFLFYSLFFFGSEIWPEMQVNFMLISYQSLYKPDLPCVWVDGRKHTEGSCSPVWELDNLARWPITLSPVFFREFWMLHHKLKLWPFSLLATISCLFVSSGKYLSNNIFIPERSGKGGSDVKES